MACAASVSAGRSEKYTSPSAAGRAKSVQSVCASSTRVAGAPLSASRSGAGVALPGMVWETAGGSGVGSVASGVTETAVSTTAGVSTTATVSAAGAVVSAQARKGAAESALLSPVRFTGTKLHTVLPSLEGV